MPFPNSHLASCVLQGAIGLELWSMSDNILFDNMIITDDKHVADEWAADTFELKMSLIKKEQV